MDLLNLPSSVFAKILCATESVVDIRSLSATCKTACNNVRDVGDVLAKYFDFNKQLSTFVDGLRQTNNLMHVPIYDIVCTDPPVGTGNLRTTSTGPTNNHVIGGPFCLFTSIRVLGAVDSLIFEVAGIGILVLDVMTLRLFADDDGSIELMRFIRIMTRPVYHTLRIYSRHATPFNMDVRWRAVDLPNTSNETWTWKVHMLCKEVFRPKMYTLVTECRLPFILKSLGIIVVVHDSGVILNDIVRSFTFRHDDHSVTVGGDACCHARIPEEFELPAAGTCYFVPFRYKINFYRIDHAALTIEFKHPLVLDVEVCLYNVVLNYMASTHDMACLRYACPI